MPPIIERNIARIIIVLAALALIAAIVVQRSCSAAHTAKTETRLATGQAGAATASGADAVGTLGNRQAADVAGDITTEETKDAIDKATDAGGVTDAGRSGLCGLAGYRGKPECVRRAHP